MFLLLQSSRDCFVFGKNAGEAVGGAEVGSSTTYNREVVDVCYNRDIITDG